EKAQEIAKENVKSLFSEDLPPKKTWDKVTVPVVTEDSKDSDAAYYSSLHKWSDQGENNKGSTQKAKRAADNTKKESSLPAHQGDGSAKNGSGDSTL
ncbi:hypothetical protein AVEN_139662-1, partial [Araneus ventricosus]